MRRVLALILVPALVCLAPLAARSDDSDIFGANVVPNIMLFIDSSGSMDDTIPAEPYVGLPPGPAYPTGTPYYDPYKVYKKTTSGYGLYANSIDDVDNSNARNSLRSVGYWSGRINRSRLNLYAGNYINYTRSPNSQVEKKIVIARRVLRDLVQHTEGVRFGLARFGGNGSMGSGGADVIAPLGTSVDALQTAIDGITPSGYTPLGESLRDLGKYYKNLGDRDGTYAGTNPIQSSCQPNFIIFMSDGLQNGSMDVRTEATLRRTQDHHSMFSGVQNVLVHTVGFAVSEAERDAANDVLDAAATNGGGTFYYSANESELSAALEDAIRQIMAATFSFATPVVPTTSATGINRAYIAAFQSDPSAPFWRGYLRAFNRDGDGLIKTLSDGTPDESPDCYADPPDNTKPCMAWEAGTALAGTSAGDRVIYTVIGGTRQSFDKTNANITTTLLGGVTSAQRDKIIDFVRGVDVYDENANGNLTEDRQWKLGDIFHSTPVLVSPPFLPSTQASYKTFRSAWRNRPALLIAGANDGMLHAFNETVGTERWALIPEDMLGKLKDVAKVSGEHQYFLDASPVAADVNFGTDASATWKTIVIFGERRGGRKYHALDITDTSAAPIYLWSFTHAKMGETWSQPVIGKIKIAGSPATFKTVAIFGGGYDTQSNNASGKAVFAVDVTNGQLLWEYSRPSPTHTGDDRQYMNYSIPAGPLALDLNGDGFLDRIYIGDVAGQLWKFDLSGGSGYPGATLSGGVIDNWTGKLFFSPTAPSATPPPAGEYYPAQAIYAAPSAALAPTTKDLWIYFGTGDRNHPMRDTAAPNTNRFYGIKDNTTGMSQGSPLTEANLSDVTSSSPVITQGWFFKLGADEKVLAASDVFNENVYFTTFTPDTSDACTGGGGTAKVYAVQMLTGFAGVNWSTHEAYKIRADGTNESSPTTEKFKVAGQGIPSKFIIVVTDHGAVTGHGVTGLTDNTLDQPPIPTEGVMRRIIFWREVVPQQ
jgi:type IV pilus assembly protein PilY1